MHGKKCHFNLLDYDFKISKYLFQKINYAEFSKKMYR